MKISIILGTRPEIIKMSPIIRKCEKQRLDYFILHTGQHYSYNLDRIFFEKYAIIIILAPVAKAKKMWGSLSSFFNLVRIFIFFITLPIIKYSIVIRIYPLNNLFL